ncbi:Hint domain-containing protein [Alisedimentitalea sp. MJ-SS2]|uniref:Hint domain-containing protein n=1 Tax=Aliisedimentitalea sp. MJ-SS2 TaxID=3049795 RepID=UPI002915B5F6|nr:Hint domain-containing protein [Alisedimentitalea sp. MJ-SS2]MDU8927408.1 Hint domain-containing protein [Alisedimentitalea sp. MJ-SS2]
MFGWISAERKGAHRVVDASEVHDGGAHGVLSGITAGTMIATAIGWREVGAVQEGDLVLTFDGGMQRVAKVTRTPLWSGSGRCPKAFWPLMVPVGAIDNAELMIVLPRQGVMLESDLAEKALGDPFALVLAAALEGARGVKRVCPADAVEVVNLHFEADQVIFAEHGALLFCPSGGDLVQIALRGKVQHCPYQMLPEPCAMELVQGHMRSGECNSCLNALRAARLDQSQGLQVAA